jgi:hypothetical protein
VSILKLFSCFLAVLLAADTARADATTPREAFTEQVIGEVPGDALITVTADRRHVYYTTGGKGRQRVVVDGRPGPEYSGSLVEGSFVLSAEGGRVGYVVAEEATNVPPPPDGCVVCDPRSRWRAVIDGEFGPEYRQVHGIAFTPDGTRFAYTAKKAFDPKRTDSPLVAVLVVDGREMPGFQEDFSRLSPAFTPDGRHVVGVVRVGERARVLVDGACGAAYDSIPHGLPFFSRAGSRMAYVGRNYTSQGVHAVIDGRPGPSFDFIPERSLVFSGDGGRCAYGAMAGGRWRVVLDDVPGREWDEVDNIALSADGRHLAYKARRDQAWKLVLDGRESGDCEGIDAPVFSPDGKRLAFGFKRKGVWRVAAIAASDSAESLPETAVEVGPPCDAFAHLAFSPDGGRVAYAIRNGDRKRVVVDGRAGADYEQIFHVAFSADSRRIAYEAQGARGRVAVVDGREQPSHEGVSAGTLVWSADSRHAAFVARQGARSAIVAAGETGAAYDAVCTLYPNGGHGFEALAVRDGRLYKVTWQPAPAEPGAAGS